MKFYETHFEEYINEIHKYNLHPKLEKIYNTFPSKIEDFKNMIFYGPSGTGKYSQMLYAIRKYSNTDLKYERKICVTSNKTQYLLKGSDIHYEVDMSLLGCNSKILWHEIYQQITDIISTKPNKTGIIVCKNFQDIHSELLEIFYNYMQKTISSTIVIKFILISEQISFIPNNIMNCCEMIRVNRPPKTSYQKCVKCNFNPKINVENVSNIKNIYSYNEYLMKPYKRICDKIIDEILHIDKMRFMRFRDTIYDIFIYNLDITDCIWYIVNSIISKNYIDKKDLSFILINTYNFLQYYNNNYRPIYHVEKYLLNIANIIHKKETA